VLHSLIIAAAVALAGPQVGTPAPDFHLVTIEGKHLDLRALRGKTVVLNDWATWCPPCREETPDLYTAARKAGTDVVFVGVDSTEAAPIVRAFAAAKSAPYAQVVDDGAFAAAYDVRAYPTTFIVGPDGVLRARFVGELDPTTLHGFLADAKAGRNGVIATAAQQKIDAMLAPSAFDFSGDIVAVRAAVKRAMDAMDAAENLDGTTDYLRTVAEENTVRDAAIAALAPLAVAPADQALLAQLRGDAASAREDWPAAIAAYKAGVALAPDDGDLLASLAQAYNESGDRAQQIATLNELSERAPSASGFIDLGVADTKAANYDDGAIAFAQAIGRGKADLAAATPATRTRALRVLASAYLYEARLFVAAEHTDKARTAFANAGAVAAQLPVNDSRYAMDSEEAQEGALALDVARPADGSTALSLAPWTGADLPGSVASTYKYRLIIAGKPGAAVALHAADLPAHWIASFCGDGQCAPFRTVLTLPASGVKVLEFQLIPQTAKRGAANVRVLGPGGAQASIAVHA
jgi:thiol-disulfide isomerase/thioredoxin